MRRYPLYIFDLDGTIYRGNEALPGAVEVVLELKKGGSKVRFLTNNSSLTRASYHSKLTGMGFPALEEEIYSSAIGVASHCLDLHLQDLFVVGEPGLVQTMREAGLNVLNAGEDNAVAAQSSGKADAVIAGICKQFTYELMSSALQQVLNGAQLIATNADATYPMEGSRLVPGAGAIIASLETCTGQEAFVIGKPNPFLIELVLNDADVAAKDALVVGDRYETDIESGIRAGADTHLVLTGVTRAAPAGQSFSADLQALLSGAK